MTIAGEEPPASKAPAIARAAAILRLLGRSDTPMGLQPIARELGLVPSTCLYVLRALVAEELVAFDAETKRYRLDAGVLTLARAWLRGNDVTTLAQPALDRLSRAFDVTTLAVQYFGLKHIVVVAVAQASNNLQLSTQVGSRFPAFISATGRCLAAFADLSEPELESRFRALRWEEPPAYADWRAEVERTRERGFGVDPGNYIAGVTVIAAPVWQAAGRPSHAIVALGLGSMLERRGQPDLERALLAAAGSLSRQIAR